MGRKNRNARPYRGSQVYSSFKEAEDAMTSVDMTKVEWVKKSRFCDSIGDYDVFLNIVKNSSSGSRKTLAIALTVKKEHRNVFGDYATYARVDAGREKRLYFKSTDAIDGYKCQKTISKTSFYLRFPIFEKDTPLFEGFIGNHNLQYDQFNDVYYITEE